MGVDKAGLYMGVDKYFVDVDVWVIHNFAGVDINKPGGWRLKGIKHIIGRRQGWRLTGIKHINGC